ncbi:MAG: serine/threonine-protein kinase, partial [Gemmatimonadota bacterium]|nr:serine/threonine-protein kinase [Gemmatimonadota bacterium]
MIDRLEDALSDRYRVERELGEGGMATVYLAEDLKHGREVALKVLRPELALAGDRFLREIRVTAGLQHPGIVPLYDSGEAGGLLYYVMPFVEGESLRDRLDRENRIPLAAALDIARAVASTLAYAHGRGVVHRDVKPANILFSQGQPLVADFGIARAVDAAAESRLTATGHSVGTPAYMSPEQAVGEEEVDERSDVYSLGCVIHEMLTGEPPFVAPTLQAMIAKRLTEPPPTVADAPADVAAMLRRSLATRPVDRFATAAELARQLVELAAAEQTRASRERDATPADPGPSIVVLPLENLSPDPDNAFFADGLTEEIISDLAQVRDLRVISRTSAMRYRDTDKDLPTIARELDVRYVLEGSVRKSGNAVRVTSQLIEAVSDDHLWSGKFGGTLDDVFEIQER